MAALLSVFLLLPPTAAGSALDEAEEVIEDGHESETLVESRGRWVPVPMIVSNPTIGTGLQGALLYLHPPKASSTRNATTGLVGMYADTESWFAGVFHDDYWADDDVRFTGFAGTGQFFLDFYGIGDAVIPGGRSIPYEFNAYLASAKLQKRLPGTQYWFAGMQYIYLIADTRVKTADLIPGVGDIEVNSKTAGLGLLATYDSRDDNYFPSAGNWFEGKWLDYGQNWGGDNEYNKIISFFNHYRPAADNFILALRTRLESSSGDVPFYDLPTLQMAGFSRDRYRDEHTISFHTEGRYKFRPRWSIIGFYEFGWFNNDLEEMFAGRRITSYGSGLHWQVVEQHQMHLGVVYAFSSDDSAVYINIGERF